MTNQFITEERAEELASEIYDVVVDTCNRNAGMRGTRKIIKGWHESKSFLFDVLSKDPNWSDEHLAVVKPIKEMIAKKDGEIQKEINKMNDLVEQFFTEDSDEHRAALVDWTHVINILVGHYDGMKSQLVITKNHVERLKEANIKASAGQKSSRFLGQWCRKVGLTAHPEYEKVFAGVSGALNPYEAKRTLVLSIHPTDYFLMSHGTGWNSCHWIGSDDPGCHSSGTTSYCLDGSTAILYTVGHDCEKDDDFQGYRFEKKISRQCFHLNKNVVIQSRLYPGNNADRTLYRKEVLEIVSNGLGVENAWTANEGMTSFGCRVTGSNHYPDHNSHCYVTTCVLDGENEVHEDVLIGEKALCTECGGRINNSGIMSCCSESDHVCNACGCNIDEDDACWIGDDCYCSDCCNYCECCGEYTTDDLTSVRRRINTHYEVQVCDDCLDNYRKCDDCGNYYHASNTSGAEGTDDIYCDNCWSDHCFVCDQCGDNYSRDQQHNTGDECLCDSCNEEGLFTCDHCKDTVHKNDMVVVKNGAGEDVRLCFYCSKKDRVEENDPRFIVVT